MSSIDYIRGEAQKQLSELFLIYNWEIDYETTGLISQAKKATGKESDQIISFDYNTLRISLTGGDIKKTTFLYWSKAADCFFAFSCKRVVVEELADYMEIVLRDVPKLASELMAHKYLL